MSAAYIRLHKMMLLHKSQAIFTITENRGATITLATKYLKLT